MVPGLKTPIFALPALVAEPHTQEFTKKGIPFKRRTVRVGPYELDAYIFQCANVAEARMTFIDVLLIVGIGQAPYPNVINAKNAKWGNRTVPYVGIKTGNIRIIPLSEKEDDKKTIEEAPYSSIRIILENFSRLAGGLDIDFYAEKRDIGRPPLPDKPNLINIFPWSYSPGYSKSKYLRRAFDLQLDTKEGNGVLTFSGTPGRGEFVGDGENDLAQIVGNNWYFLFCVVEFFNSLTSLKILDNALAVTLRRYQALQGGAKPSDKMLRLNRKRFVDVTTKWISTVSGGIDREVQKIQQEIEDLRMTLAINERECFNLQRLSKTVSNALPKDELFRSLKGQWRRIRSNPYVSELSLAEDMIRVTTIGADITNAGNTHQLGRFAFAIHRNGDFYIWSLDRFHPEGVPHPHINKEGTPCFGNAGTAIKDAIKEHRYADGIGYFTRWLFEGYEDQTALHKIAEWPIKVILDEGGVPCIGQ
ncbi:MAG: hypothetical protein Q7S19_00170 [bacterium]|nr:hypothetical protein [bacterium]